MSAANALSLLCLVITGGIAAWGIFSSHFDDNLLQRLGLSGVAIACFLRAPDKFFAVVDPPSEILLAQVSLSIYAIGTALKLWRQHHAGGRTIERRRLRRGLG